MLSKLELAATQTDAYHAYIHTANLESVGRQNRLIRDPQSGGHRPKDSMQSIFHAHVWTTQTDLEFWPGGGTQRQCEGTRVLT